MDFAKKAAGTTKKAQLPKTAAAAARAGHKRVKVSFARLSESDKKKWVARIATTGKRLNLAGTYREWVTDGQVIRCYYNPNTGGYDICHKIS